MFNSTTNKPGVLKAAVVVAFSAALVLSPFALAQEPSKEKSDAAGTQEITGEVLDMMCYIDHGASGEKHASCAKKCIEGGGPVGIKSGDKTYLIIGDHKPMNAELAPLAAKTITVKGKVVERDGISMIENAEIVKK
jgi:hypothetical protein